MENNSKLRQNGRAVSNGEVKFTIEKYIGNIGELNNGWQREVNLVAWNDKIPGIDIRAWNDEHNKMTKGVNLSVAEGEILKNILVDYYK